MFFFSTHSPCMWDNRWYSCLSWDYAEVLVWSWTDLSYWANRRCPWGGIEQCFSRIMECVLANSEGGNLQRGVGCTASFQRRWREMSGLVELQPTLPCAVWRKISSWFLGWLLWVAQNGAVVSSKQFVHSSPCLSFWEWHQCDVLDDRVQMQLLEQL